MKHTHRIIRLLTLAVVSCALAALLSGCTKEEFIAGYNEFLFGDWFPSPPSAGETTAAEGSASGDSGHVYAEPNPECDAKISSLMSELYSLESSARSDVSSAIQSAKDEYHALPASQRTFANKVSIAYKHRLIQPNNVSTRPCAARYPAYRASFKLLPCPPISISRLPVVRS